MITKALEKIINHFDTNKIPYMVFGGIANSIHGNPRQTFDIDIKVQINMIDNLQDFVKKLSKIAKILPENPIDFINETNVLPAEINNVKIDIVFAGIEFEFKAIQNSKIYEFGGINIKVCSIEDLIIQKSVSQRRKDWLDIETMTEINQEKIDWKYLLDNILQLSEILENPKMYNDIKNMKI